MSCNWIKEGAKYRVTGREWGHKFQIGDTVWWNGNANHFTNGRDNWYLEEYEVELVKSNTLTVGKTYTSKNGHEWLCIAVNGEYAHMRMPDNPASSAYCFKADGTNISQGGGEWDIKFEPVRESIEVHGSFDRASHPDYITLHHDMGDHKFIMTIDMVDGEPDWSSAKLTRA